MKIDLGFSPRDAAVAPADELVWIPHYGGDNPVRWSEVLAAARFRNGETDRPSNRAYEYDWKHNNSPFDITHYAVTPPRVAAPVTEPAPMSADEVLIRAREAFIESEYFSASLNAIVRNGSSDDGRPIRAILAFHRDLSKPLAEVAPHTVEDADERVAWEIYQQQLPGSLFSFEERNETPSYSHLLAAYRAGKAAR